MPEINELIRNFKPAKLGQEPQWKMDPGWSGALGKRELLYGAALPFSMGIRRLMESYSNSPQASEPKEPRGYLRRRFLQLSSIAGLGLLTACASKQVLKKDTPHNNINIKPVKGDPSASPSLTERLYTEAFERAWGRLPTEKERIQIEGLDGAVNEGGPTHMDKVLKEYLKNEEKYYPRIKFQGVRRETTDLLRSLEKKQIQQILTRTEPGFFGGFAFWNQNKEVTILGRGEGTFPNIYTKGAYNEISDLVKGKQINRRTDWELSQNDKLIGSFTIHDLYDDNMFVLPHITLERDGYVVKPYVISKEELQKRANKKEVKDALEEVQKVSHSIDGQNSTIWEDVTIGLGVGVINPILGAVAFGYSQHLSNKFKSPVQYKTKVGIEGLDRRFSDNDISNVTDPRDGNSRIIQPVYSGKQLEGLVEYDILAPDPYVISTSEQLTVIEENKRGNYLGNKLAGGMILASAGLLFWLMHPGEETTIIYQDKPKPQPCTPKPPCN